MSLGAGFALDRQWHWLRGEMETTKKPALMALCRILNESGTPYAIIGGIAVQIHHPDPRTTIDIDVAVPSRNDIPAAELEAAGFRRGGSFTHSENWIASDGTPVQFSDDAHLASAIESSDVFEVDGVRLRVIKASHLLREKIRSGRDAQRRRSKQLQDLADAIALVEAQPRLAEELSVADREFLDAISKPGGTPI